MDRCRPVLYHLGTMRLSFRPRVVLCVPSSGQPTTPPPPPRPSTGIVRQHCATKWRRVPDARQTWHIPASAFRDIKTKGPPPRGARPYLIFRTPGLAPASLLSRPTLQAFCSQQACFQSVIVTPLPSHPRGDVLTAAAHSTVSQPPPRAAPARPIAGQRRQSFRPPLRCSDVTASI